MSLVKGGPIRRLSAEEQRKLQREVARLRKDYGALEEQNQALEISYKEEIAELMNIWSGVSQTQLEGAKKDAGRRAMESVNDAMRRLTTVRG